MAAENPFKSILKSLEKPDGGEFGKYYNLLALNDPRVDKLPYSIKIMHQSEVNLEYLGRVVFNSNGLLYPDSVVGTDSHTTMIDGLGVAGWVVGGIEAEATMLGQPMSMVLPSVVGFKLLGKLRDGVTATDLVRTVTQMLRKHGVVGKFVEFYGISTYVTIVTSDNSLTLLSDSATSPILMMTMGW